MLLPPHVYLWSSSHHTCTCGAWHLVILIWDVYLCDLNVGHGEGFQDGAGDRKQTKGKLVQPLQGDVPTPAPPHPTPARGGLRLCQAGDQRTSRSERRWWAVLSVPWGWPCSRLSAGWGGRILEGEELVLSSCSNTSTQFIKPRMENSKEQNLCVACWISKHGFYVQVL